MASIKAGKTFWITSKTIGKGDEELGALLMEKFLYALARGEEVPERVVLMNDGVKLACEGSAVIADLQALVDAGVSVEACGTCLDYYQLRDKLAVGVAGAMPNTVAEVVASDDVVVIR